MMTKVAAIGQAGEKDTAEADLALTRQAAAGDPAAGRELICRVMERVQHTCDYLAGADDGEDLAQLALMQVVRSAGTFRGESSLLYWVDRVTVRTAAKTFEKQKRRRLLFASACLPRPETTDAEEGAALGQVRRRLRRHFAAISEKQRIVVVMHYLYEYEIPEIGELLDLKINAVRSRLRKGLKRLRRSILADPCLREWLREGKP